VDPFGVEFGKTLGQLAGNRRPLNLLTAYAVFVGAAMVALVYVPDIPFFVLGLASLALIVATKLKDRSAQTSINRDEAPPSVPQAAGAQR
jgi:hypothetical protein